MLYLFSPQADESNDLFACVICTKRNDEFQSYFGNRRVDIPQQDILARSNPLIFGRDFSIDGPSMPAGRRMTVFSGRSSERQDPEIGSSQTNTLCQDRIFPSDFSAGQRRVGGDAERYRYVCTEGEASARPDTGTKRENSLPPP